MTECLSRRSLLPGKSKNKFEKQIHNYKFEKQIIAVIDRIFTVSNRVFNMFSLKTSYFVVYLRSDDMTLGVSIITYSSRPLPRAAYKVFLIQFGNLDETNFEY